MKVVLDTNTVIKAATGKGIARKLFDLWLDDKFQILISNSILLEYEEVLNRQKFKFPKWAVANFLYPFLNYAIKVSPEHYHDFVIEDPDDNKFIDCAIEGSANFIVSDDKHLLKLRKIENIKIITPNRFLKLFK